MNGRSGILQRKCACGGSAGLQGECDECKKKKQVSPQRRAAGAGPSIAPPIVQDVLRSPGKPLDSGTRTLLEPHFGHSFASVRVHTDTQSAESARAVNATAYTVGEDVVFDSGQYAPQTARGQQLLAHELTHVVQQRGAAQADSLTVDSPTSQAEREADRFSAQVSPLPTSRVQRTVGGAIAGGLIGGLAGAGIGAMFGPAGAILGGLVGLIGGALLGNLNTRSRKLKPGEIEHAKTIFKDSIDYSKIEITRDSLFAVGAPRTIGNTIHLKSDEKWQEFKGDTLDLSDESSTQIRPTGEQVLIHEMTHVWQYQNGGIAYMPKSIISQIKASVSGGDRGGAYEWRDAIKNGTAWEDLNPEQQAKLVEDYNVHLEVTQRPGVTPENSAEDFKIVSEALPYIQKIRNREGAPTFGSSKKVQKKSRSQGSGGSAETPAPASVHAALRSAGRPLDAATRQYMEPRFGHDFSDVRIHTGIEAAASARAVDALAYTVGRDIVLDAKHYDPATGRGTHLLAHELAHVVQQSGSSSASNSGALLVGSGHDPAEREAEHVADRTVAGDGAVSRQADHTGYLRRQQAGDGAPKDPDPWLRLGPDWSLNPGTTLPKLGGGSLEDIHKGWCYLSKKCGKESTNPCPPSWVYHKSEDGKRSCCPTYTTDDKCCSPEKVIMKPAGWACPEKPKAVGPGPRNDAPQTAPPPAAQPAPKVDPGRSLTVDRPVHFLQNQPGTVVASEAGLRSSLTESGKTDLTLLLEWLVKYPTFGVQLTGMASIEGTPAINLQLGENRARSVANVLVARGVDRGRITEPAGSSGDCPTVSAGVHNCGDSQASKTVNPNDRVVRARLFVMPERPRP